MKCVRFKHSRESSNDIFTKEIFKKKQEQQMLDLLNQSRNQEEFNNLFDSLITYGFAYLDLEIEIEDTLNKTTNPDEV